MATTKKKIERTAAKAGGKVVKAAEQEIVYVERKLGWKLSAVMVALLVLAGYAGWLTRGWIS